MKVKYIKKDFKMSKEIKVESVENIIKVVSFGGSNMMLHLLSKEVNVYVSFENFYNLIENTGKSSLIRKGYTKADVEKFKDDNKTKTRPEIIGKKIDNGIEILIGSKDGKIKSLEDTKYRGIFAIPDSKLNNYYEIVKNDLLESYEYNELKKLHTSDNSKSSDVIEF